MTTLQRNWPEEVVTDGSLPAATCNNVTALSAGLKRLLTRFFRIIGASVRKSRLNSFGIGSALNDHYKMPNRDSENWASTSDPKDDAKYPPCPGCGGPVEQNGATGGMK